MNFKEMQEKASGVNNSVVGTGAAASSPRPAAIVERTWTPEVSPSSKPVLSVSQDFSEADSDVQVETLFPDLYKIFYKKVEELAPYVGIAENPYDYQDEIFRLKLFGQLSFAMRKASEALAWAYVQQKMAYARRKEAEAVAAMDDFPQYIVDQSDQGRTIKATDATREAFVKMSPRVMRAHQKEAFVDAIVEQLNVLKYGFSEGSKTLRAMCYGQKDSNNLSSMNNTGT
jgi:hypothetical protein